VIWADAPSSDEETVRGRAEGALPEAAGAELAELPAAGVVLSAGESARRICGRPSSPESDCADAALSCEEVFAPADPELPARRNTGLLSSFVLLCELPLSLFPECIDWFSGFDAAARSAGVACLVWRISVAV
jgi:hypothetical protein